MGFLSGITNKYNARKCEKAYYEVHDMMNDAIRNGGRIEEGSFGISNGLVFGRSRTEAVDILVGTQLAIQQHISSSSICFTEVGGLNHD